MKTLAERMRWVVANSGKTASRLGTDAGLSPSQIGPIARGKVGPGVTLGTIEKIAVYTHVSPGWLAFGEGIPKVGTGEFPELETALARRRQAIEDLALAARELAATMPAIPAKTWDGILEALSAERSEHAAERAPAASTTLPLGSQEALGPVAPGNLKAARARLTPEQPDEIKPRKHAGRRKR